MLRPESRGEITLASADPTAPPRIRQNFLSTEGDRRTIRDGLKLVRRIVGTAPLSTFVARELAPGADIERDDDLDAYIRATAATRVRDRIRHSHRRNNIGCHSTGRERALRAANGDRARTPGVVRPHRPRIALLSSLILRRRKYHAQGIPNMTKTTPATNKYQ